MSLSLLFQGFLHCSSESETVIFCFGKLRSSEKRRGPRGFDLSELLVLFLTGPGSAGYGGEGRAAEGVCRPRCQDLPWLYHGPSCRVSDSRRKYMRLHAVILGGVRIFLGIISIGDGRAFYMCTIAWKEETYDCRLHCTCSATFDSRFSEHCTALRGTTSLAFLASSSPSSHSRRSWAQRRGSTSNVASCLWWTTWPSTGSSSQPPCWNNAWLSWSIAKVSLVIPYM